jgi:hypothetical protein
MLLGSRRLCKECEETGSGGTDEAELNGKRASGAVAELLVARARGTALAGGAGAGRRGGHGAGGGGASGGSGTVVDRERSGDSCGGSSSSSSSGGGRLSNGARDCGLNGLGDRAGSGLGTSSSTLGGGSGGNAGDNRRDSGGDLGVLGDGGCDSSRSLGGWG